MFTSAGETCHAWLLISFATRSAPHTIILHSHFIIMRKIEKQMLSAIYEQRDWRCDNTEVLVIKFPHNGANIDRTYVRLHGSTIATITPDEVEISDCGWQTPTTKSRLNAITRELCDNTYIYQQSHVWYIEDRNGKPASKMIRGSRHVFKRR